MITTASPHSTAGELLAAIRAKDVSSRELLEMYLARIDRYNGQLNAVVTVGPDQARAAARAADDAAARGHWLGPLHGLPMTIKDALLTAGIRTTAGAIDDFVPDHDAEAVARLRAAGAIIFGKTNVPPWSGDSQTSNPIFGRTANPWRLALSPGGSSGGAAAAVSAGLTAAELGTDLGGSVRIPASHSGICGHKPSQGVVSAIGDLLFPGSQDSERDLEVVGPLARSAADLDLILRALVSPRMPGRPVPRPGRDPRPMRLAAWLVEPGHPVSADVRDVYEVALAALAEAGFAVTSCQPGPVDLDRGTALSVELAAAGLALSAPAADAGGLSHRDWLVLDDERRRMREAWDRFCDGFDAVLCPVAATTATPHDDETTGTRMVSVDGAWQPETAGTAWSVLASGLHLPATVIPAGLTSTGLPVGIQIVGAAADDWTVLAVARRIEAVLGLRLVPPGYAE